MASFLPSSCSEKMDWGRGWPSTNKQQETLMQVLPSKAKEEKKYSTGSYSRGLRNQNGEHLVNLCKSNILEIQVIFSIVN